MNSLLLVPGKIINYKLKTVSFVRKRFPRAHNYPVTGKFGLVCFENIILNPQSCLNCEEIDEADRNALNKIVLVSPSER